MADIEEHAGMAKVKYGDTELWLITIDAYTAKGEPVPPELINTVVQDEVFKWYTLKQQ